MSNENEELNKSQNISDFEKSIQEQIKEHEQNPSVLLNGLEFLEMLSSDVKTPQQEQSPLIKNVPQKSFTGDLRDELIKQHKLKFELLKQLQKRKDQEQER